MTFRTLCGWQLGAAGALALPLGSFLAGQPLPPGAVALSGAVLVGCGAVSWALYFYGKRYVGQLALISEPSLEVPRLRISTLSFWGTREDGEVALDRVDPPFAGLEDPIALGLAKSSMFALPVQGDRDYIMTMRWWPHEDNAPETKQILSVISGTHEAFQGRFPNDGILDVVSQGGGLHDDGDAQPSQFQAPK